MANTNNTRQGFLFEPSRPFIDDSESDFDEVGSSSDEEQSSRTDNLLWCICGQCGLMPSIVESVCCQEDDVFGVKMDSENGIYCIAETEAFRKACLDPLILEIIMASLKEVVGEDLRDPISNRFVLVVLYITYLNFIKVSRVIFVNLVFCTWTLKPLLACFGLTLVCCTP